MSQWSEDKAPGAQDMSALLDGEFDEASVDLACARWRESEEARADWHTYHLIGDVLRSDDLATSAEHDSDFLARLRERLMQEPVVVAPEAVVAPSPFATGVPRRHWRASFAVAAGFAAVAGVLIVTQMSGGAGDPVMAWGPALATTSVSSVGPGASAALESDRVIEQADVVLDGKLVRDARLDEYLAAHKKFGGSSAPGGPSGFLRNAAAEGR